MSVLESRIALALMVKAQRVFASPGKVLSFPITPVSFRAEEMQFIKPGGFTAETLNALSNFSRHVNMLPKGLVWDASDGRYLWDVYEEILRQARVADGGRSPQEEAQYRAAREVLFEALSEGGARDTSEYKRYKEYKDAYILARERYNQAKLTGELSADNAVQQQWRNVTEPALREALEKLNSDWELRGAKSKIEAALSALEVLRIKAPVVTWSEWSHRFDPSIAGLTDAAGTRFMPTFFSPSNALKDGWQKFSVTGAEVDRLITEAPPELRTRLATGTRELEVDTLTFEYSSARLMRSWCDGALFEARFWKFDDAARRISAGSDGYSGECPLYAAAAVFARNIKATLKPASASTAPLPSAGRNVNLGPVQLAPRPATSVVRDHRGAKVAPTRVVRAVASKPPPTTGHAAVAHQLESARKARTVARRDIARRDPRLLVKVAPPRAVPASPHALPTPRQPSPPAMQATDPDAIYILGFICNVVPAPCPNPDLALFGH